METDTVRAVLATQFLKDDRMQVRVSRYSALHQENWDDFVDKSKNATFLFKRDYMDYHKDRFEDHSLMINAESGELIAILPANAQGQHFNSHSGLTYGGFIVDESMDVLSMLHCFESTIGYLRERGFHFLKYKTVPHVYHKLPAEEDRYALFLSGARIVARSVLAVLECSVRPPLQYRRKRGIRRALANQLHVSLSEDFEGFWNVLEENLADRHNSKPVHTLNEIRSLQSRFPKNIRLFICKDSGSILAGVVVYETEKVARAQYIASSEQGRKSGAVDLVLNHLIEVEFAQKPFIDLGSSDAVGRSGLNRGLLEQKEGFGARCVVQDIYELSLDEFRSGQLVEAMP